MGITKVNSNLSKKDRDILMSPFLCTSSPGEKINIF